VCSWVVFPDRQTRLDEILLLCLGLVAALTKPVLSVPLLPAIALGLYLDRIRTAPTEPAPAIRSLAQAFAGRWVFAAGLVVISVTGLAFASTSLNPENPRPGAQLEFVLENPLHAPALILSKFVTFFWHPSVFIDNLGYGSTRIGAGTLACFGMLVAIVVFVELAGLGTQIDRLRKGRTHRGGVRRAWGPVAGVAIVAITCLVASAFAIGFRSYLVASPIGGNRLYAMQARYLFPCLIVGIGLAIAMTRTFLTDPGRSDVPTRAARRTERVAAAVVIGFAAATLLAFSAQLATDLLARYS